MKTASMVLGIVGGAIAIITGLLYAFGLSAFLGGFFEGFARSSDSFDFSYLSNLYNTLFIVFGIVCTLSGVLGLIGGIIVKKHNIAAGVMMIVAAVMSISFILFLLGGIFALMKEKPQYAPQPYPQYPPYPPAPPQA